MAGRNFSSSDFSVILDVEYDVSEQNLKEVSKFVSETLKKYSSFEIIDKTKISEGVAAYKELWEAAKKASKEYLDAVTSGNTKMMRQAQTDLQAITKEMDRIYSTASSSSAKHQLNLVTKEQKKDLEDLVASYNTYEKSAQRAATQQVKAEKQAAQAAKERAKEEKEQVQISIDVINQQLKARQKAAQEEQALARQSDQIRLAQIKEQEKQTAQATAQVDKYSTSADTQIEKISKLVYYLERNAQEVDKVTSAYKNGDITISQARERLERLSTTYDSLSMQTRTVESRVDNLNKEFKESITSSSDAQRKYDELGESLNTLKQKAAQAETSIGNLGDSLNTGGISGWLKNFGAGFKSGFFGEVGGMAIGVKAANEAIELFAQGVRLTIDTVRELDEQMTQIQMVAGTTHDETMRLFQDYNNLAQELSVTTKNVASGAAEWLRQGRSQSETMDLIRASTIQATLAQIEYGESTTLLTSTLNGYKMEAQEAMHVVDALVQVDFKAATSVQEMATALQKTANTARTSGVDFERLVGYIAAVSEGTRQAPELIGRAYRTLFSRMQNIRAGVDIDENGESVNDVEKVLNSLGIKLRETNDTFREMDAVLDDVYHRWESFSDAEKNQLATAIAGERFARAYSDICVDDIKFGEHPYGTIPSETHNWGRITTIICLSGIFQIKV